MDRLVPLVTLCLLTVCGLKADLEFEQTVVRIEAKLGDKEGTGVFRFENTGSRAVEVTDLKTTCGCTLATLDKRKFGPGETGEIEVRFRFEDRTGPQQKKITLKADDQPYVLYVRTEVPAYIRVEPGLLGWSLDAPPESKTASIELAENENLGEPRIVNEVSGFLLDLREEKNGGWLLVVQPRPNQPRITQVARISVADVDGERHEARLFLLLR